MQKNTSKLHGISAKKYEPLWNFIVFVLVSMLSDIIWLQKNQIFEFFASASKKNNTGRKPPLQPEKKNQMQKSTRTMERKYPPLVPPIKHSAENGEPFRSHRHFWREKNPPYKNRHPEKSGTRNTPCSHAAWQCACTTGSLGPGSLVFKIVMWLPHLSTAMAPVRPKNACKKKGK